MSSSVTTSATRRDHRGRRLLLGGVALAAAAGLAGAGVYAAFTDTETADVDVTTGALDIVGAGDITVTDVAPGDVIFRDVGVSVPAGTNSGDLIQAIAVSIGDVTDTVGAPVDTGDVDVNPPGQPAGSSLVSGANGIRVVLASCVGGSWTIPAANAAVGTPGANGLYPGATCSSNQVVAQPEIPLSQFVASTGANPVLTAEDFGVTPTETGTIPDGANLSLLAQMRLPDAADNSYENASASFDLTFEALQRSGVTR